MANESDALPLTVLDAIKHVFPCVEFDGADSQASYFTQPYDSWPVIKGFPREHAGRHSVPKELRQPYAMPPLSPFDLFAVAGHLIEQSGIYHHIGAARKRPGTASARKRSARVLDISEREISVCKRLADQWRADLDIKLRSGDQRLRKRAAELRDVVAAWDLLVGKFGEAPLVLPEYEADPERWERFNRSGSTKTALEDLPPRWWRLAVWLLIIADETAREAGFELVPKSVREKRLWFMEYLDEEQMSAIKRAQEQDADEPARDVRALRDVNEWSSTFSQARMSVVCVLPKGRTTAVGCTMRSLSHHLALLPGHGISKARWIPRYREKSVRSLAEDNEFNLLLVPFPFTVTADEFVPSSGDDLSPTEWGFFRLRQTWLWGYGGPYRRDRMIEMLANFVDRLAEQAQLRHSAKRIDAVVFPELAFDYKVFMGLTKSLRTKIPTLQFLIGGLSYDSEGREGNFVGVAALYEKHIVETVREKHHRWKLDRSQIWAYGLEGMLDPRRGWWEDIDLLSRHVDFTVFRTGSVLAAMICEDLARIDPCQELLRSVGPNLIIALLMDAPQLSTRWPARYATVLAEDPGSSVLTLTSRGLMTHQRAINRVPGTKVPGEAPASVIAMWRDNDSGKSVEIECPDKSHGVWLKLLGAPARDFSLDGRLDTTAIAWSYGLHHALEVPNVDHDFAALLGREDQQLRPPKI